MAVKYQPQTEYAVHTIAFVDTRMTQLIKEHFDHAVDPEGLTEKVQNSRDNAHLDALNDQARFTDEVDDLMYPLMEVAGGGENHFGVGDGQAGANMVATDVQIVGYMNRRYAATDLLGGLLGAEQMDAELRELKENHMKTIGEDIGVSMFMGGFLDGLNQYAVDRVRVDRRSG